MLKFLSSAQCGPCTKTQLNVVHPIKRKSDASATFNICRECQTVFPTQEQLELHSIRGTCRTSIQYDNISPYLPQSKPSLSEDNQFSESRKEIGSALLDRFSFIKAFITRTPNSPSKTQIIERSPKSATSKTMLADLVTFGNNSPDKSPDRSPDRSPTMLQRMNTKFSSARQIVPSSHDLSIADVGLESIIETVKETKSLAARVKIEAKFIKQYMNKRAIKKYLVDNYWMDSYSRYLNGEKKELPGPIDNRELKKQVMVKNYPEPLFAVNETIWSFFKNLYGGGPEISHSTSSHKRIMLEPVSAKMPRIEKTGSNKSVKSTHYLEENSIEMPRGKKKATSSYRLSLHDMNFNLRPIVMLNEKNQDGLIACVQMLLGVTDLLRVMENERYREIMRIKSPIYWPAFQEVIDAHLKGLSQFALGGLKRLVRESLSAEESFDAFEVLNFILKGMDNEVQTKVKKREEEEDNHDHDHDFVNGSLLLTINDLFGGVVQDIFKCLSCGKKSRKERNFLILSLPVIPNQTRTIDDCLAAFEKECEVEDVYSCESCRTEGKASKRSILYRFPKNLLVHFQRFPKNSEKKIDNFVHYLSESWRIKGKGEPENSTYTLTSAISHKGQLDSGHFLSYNKRGDSWFMCDDEEIKKISSKPPVVNDAYILSYLRKSS